MTPFSDSLAETEALDAASRTESPTTEPALNTPLINSILEGMNGETQGDLSARILRQVANAHGNVPFSGQVCSAMVLALIRHRLSASYNEPECKTIADSVAARMIAYPPSRSRIEKLWRMLLAESA